jgi:hypothetical protein
MASRPLTSAGDETPEATGVEPDAPPPAPLSATQAAWLALLPVTAVTVAAIVVLGPPLGRILFPRQNFGFFADWLPLVLPEPTEQARFLVSLIGPVLLVAATLLLVRRAPRLAPATARRLVIATQVVGLLAIVACFVSQRLYRFGSLYTSADTTSHTVYFTLPTLIVAAAIAAGIVAGARSPGMRARVARWTAETTVARWTALAIAVAMIAITLLPAINTDDSARGFNVAAAYHLQFTFDEAMAVVDGRSPLGNFAAQYGSLWPYVTGAALGLLGSSLIVFTTAMAAITGLSMLAMFDVLRRLTRRLPVALLLFLPLLATSAYMARGPFENRYSMMNYFGTFPLRYAGPLLLAWLTARHLDGAWPRRAWPLFLAGGLVLMNNVDFGVAAVGGTVAALLWTRGRPTARGLRELVLEGAAGLAGAIALVAALVLVRTGGLPHPALLSAYAKIFAVGGFSMLPMRPVVGFSTVIYLTYAAAIGTATTRAIRGTDESDRLLTGLLAWSGIFGLGAGAYYMGRSHPEVLTNELPAWALATTFLTVASLRWIAASGGRRIALPAVACLFGFGLLACSLAQTPLPWAQVQRIESTGGEGTNFRREDAVVFVQERTHPGDHVVILMQLSHRVAAEADVQDVTPFTSASIVTHSELDETLRALRDEGGHEVFVGNNVIPGIVSELARHGFRQVATAANAYSLWSDA